MIVAEINNARPLVSVLLLSWNHEKYIKQCIDSLVSQTYSDIEIIYVDNDSNDKTFEIGESFLENSGRKFKAYRNSVPKKVSENLNFLFSQAAGEYILVLSTDDWLTPDCIEKKVNYYTANPGLGLLYNKGWIYYDDTGEMITPDASNYKRGKITESLLYEENILFFIGIMYSRKVIEAVGGWDNEFLIEDLDMFYRISLSYEVDFVPDYLSYYRRTSTSASSNIEFMIKGWEQFYNKHNSASSFNLKKWMAEKYRAYSAKAIDNGDKKLAIKLLKKSFLLNPLSADLLRTFLYKIRKG